MKKIIQKFEETGDLGVIREKRKKWTLNEFVEGVALAIIEESLVPDILCQALEQYHVISLSRGLSTVQKILKSILKWYSYKISFVEQLNPAYSEKVLILQPIFWIE